VSAGAFDDSGGDRPAALQGGGIVEAGALVLEVGADLFGDFDFAAAAHGGFGLDLLDLGVGAVDRVDLHRLIRARTRHNAWAKALSLRSLPAVGASPREAYATVTD
jgi:hypothetical protein